MRAQPPKNSESLSLTETEHIDRLCDSFESGWRAGDSPRIENYLGAVDPSQSPVLLHELIALEVELRSEGGEHPTPADYHGRFPGLDSIVDEVFRESPENQ